MYIYVYIYIYIYVGVCMSLAASPSSWPWKSPFTPSQFPFTPIQTFPLHMSQAGFNFVMVCSSVLGGYRSCHENPLSHLSIHTYLVSFTPGGTHCRRATFDRCSVCGGVGSSCGRLWCCSCRVVCCVVLVACLCV